MFVVVGVWVSPLTVVAVVAVVVWRAWWVLPVAAVCGVLAVVAAARAARAADRRGALATAHWPVQQQLRDAPVREVPAAQQPAIGPVYNFNFYGAAGETQAAVIRKAITGTAGDVRPEG